MNKHCVDSVKRESHSMLTKSTWSLTILWISGGGVSLHVDSVCGEENKPTRSKTGELNRLWCLHRERIYRGNSFQEKIYLSSIEPMRRYLVLVLYSKQNQGEESEDQARPFDENSRGQNLMQVYLF